MLTKLALTAMALAAAGVVTAQETPAAQAAAPQAAAQQTPAPQAPVHQAGASPKDPKSMSGMSILGNQDAPKSLVIVPWKSSEIGNGIGVSRALDTSIRAVDRDVFMRELKYYGIRSGAEK
jgi:curli biogenesis system outer membrane secretion channel CsgG